MLNVEPETGTDPLTDVQMYTEVGNLVFAGTGFLISFLVNGIE
jgi:hypothetical protein